MEPASPFACVSASLSLCVSYELFIIYLNKILKKNDKFDHIEKILIYLVRDGIKKLKDSWQTEIKISNLYSKALTYLQLFINQRNRN